MAPVDRAVREGPAVRVPGADAVAQPAGVAAERREVDAVAPRREPRQQANNYSQRWKFWLAFSHSTPS